MTALVSTWLHSGLAPLAPFLARTDVTDIWINMPGEIWVEALGQQPCRHVLPGLTDAHLLRLVRQVAAHSAQAISRRHPILSASLPGGERVQVVMPPATRGAIAIAIRKPSVASLDLAAYVVPIDDAGAATPLVEGDDVVALLRGGVNARRNILISGGTSTGKTTFLNALIAEIAEHERLVLIEDTPEINVAQPNHVGLLAVRGGQGEAEVTAEDLLIASLRLRPDRIILGEIRGAEAATFLRAINTGHPGSLSTIHADSPLRAIDQLALLVLQTGIRMTFEDVVTYVRRSIDIIVQLERSGGQRRISQTLTLERFSD